MARNWHWFGLFPVIFFFIHLVGVRESGSPIFFLFCLCRSSHIMCFRFGIIAENFEVFENDICASFYVHLCKLFSASFYGCRLCLCIYIYFYYFAKLYSIHANNHTPTTRPDHNTGTPCPTLFEQSMSSFTFRRI